MGNILKNKPNHWVAYTAKKKFTSNATKFSKLLPVNKISKSKYLPLQFESGVIKHDINKYIHQ